jgi:microcystin-dependent protein
MAIKVYRTPQDRAVVVEISPTQKKGYPNGLRLTINNDTVTAYDNSNNQQVFSTLFLEITKQDNSPYATFEELQDVAGFRSGGGGGGSVNSVTASAPLTSSGGVNPNISFATQPDGSYALSFSGGVPTLIPIEGETVGSYKAFATTAIPANYLWCNGAILPIASYPDLFAVIGNDYGGDGITTFAVPNLQGRFLQGDNGSNIGTSDGANTLTQSQLPAVNASGTIDVSTNPPNVNVGNGSFFANTDSFIANGSQGTTVSVAGVNVNFGSNQPHEHPHTVVRWAICFQSVGVSGASPTPSFEQTLAVNNYSSIRAFFNGLPYLTEDDVPNIYTADGNLTGDRTVNLDDRQITFSSIGGSGLARFIVLNNNTTNQTVLDVQPNVLGIQSIDFTDSSSNLMEIGNGSSLLRRTVGGQTIEINIGNNGIIIKDEVFVKGLEGEDDFSANYTANSYVQKSYVDNKPSIIEYYNSIILGAVTIGDTTDILVVNPISTLTDLIITLSNPTADGKEVKVFFGGDITSGNVIDTLTVIGNTNGATIVSGQLANPTQLITTNVVAGDSLTFTYSQSLNKWYIS